MASFKSTSMTGEVLNDEVKFMSNEHKDMGDSIKLSDGTLGTSRFTLARGWELTYGDALSLCGDYYSAGMDPISSAATDEEATDRFLKSFECLNDDDHDPKRMYSVSTNDTLSAMKTLSSPACRNYVLLGINNYDHFPAMHAYTKEEQGGLGNWYAYSVGHGAACKLAAGGGTNKSVLERALIMNACASHYLSDMFAAGHMRVPRRQLAGYWLEELMHNEDNQLGLNVRNKRGDAWRAYGDGCLDDKKNAKGKRIQAETVAASAEAVLQAYRSGSASACIQDETTANLVPDLHLVQNFSKAKELGNTAPMFVVKNEAGKLQGPGKLAVWADMRDSCDLNGWDTYRSAYNLMAHSISEAQNENATCPDAKSRAKDTQFNDMLCLQVYKNPDGYEKEPAKS